MLRAYMKDDITVLFNEGETDWQEPEATLDIDMKAYIVWKTHWVRNFAGEQVVSRGMIYIIYDRLINHKDKIKIGTVEYVVLSLSAGKDFSSNHQEVHFQ